MEPEVGSNHHAPGMKNPFGGSNERPTRDRVLLLARFLRLSFVGTGFPRTDLFMVVSIDANGIVPEYLNILCPGRLVHPFCGRLTLAVIQ